MLNFINKLILVMVVISVTTIVGAIEDEDLKQNGFYLLPTEDQVKLLNQKLEYRFTEDQSLQIGNLIISSENLKLTLSGDHSAILETPLQFTVGGSLLLRDPHGRALWSAKVKDLKDIEIGKSSDKTPAGLRSESARFRITDFDSLRTTLVQSSFFSLCAFNETKLNRILVCSPNYTLTKNADQWELQPLESSVKENYMMVNSTEVNEHGIIQFDQNIKTVSITAKLVSGITVEIKTDYVELDLLDLSYDESKALFFLTLAEKNNAAKKIYPWKSQISKQDPFLYIEAYGQVPLRQEISVKSEQIPLPSDRPKLVSGANATYLSSVALTFQEKPNLVMTPKNKGDSVVKQSPNLIWKINNLKMGINNPHLVSIKSNNKSLVGSFQVERGPSWDVALYLGASALSNKTTGVSSTSSSDSGVGGRLILQKYFEGFFGNNSPTQHLRWSAHLDYSNRHFSQSKLAEGASAAELGYRLSSNLHHSDGGYTVRMGWLGQTLATTGSSTKQSWLGFRLTHDGPSEWLPLMFGQTHNFNWGYFPIPLSAEHKNSSLMLVSWESRYTISSKYFWSWMLNLEQSESKATSTKSTQLFSELAFGLGTMF